MQPIPPVEKPKKSFGRTLLYFALGLVGLMVLSSVFGRYLSEDGFGDGKEKIALVGSGRSDYGLEGDRPPNFQIPPGR